MRFALLSAPAHSLRTRSHHRRRLLGFGVAVVLAAPLSAATAHASAAAGTAENAAVVSDWNATGVAALAGDTTKVPQEWPLYLAFMHAAIYDAVVGVEGRYRPYVFHGRAPAGAAATAAAVAAAHKILETYEPYAQSALDAALAASLAGIPDGTAKTDGVAFGERVAQKLIDLRATTAVTLPCPSPSRRRRACGGRHRLCSCRWPCPGSAG